MPVPGPGHQGSCRTHSRSGMGVVTVFIIIYFTFFYFIIIYFTFFIYFTLLVVRSFHLVSGRESREIWKALLLFIIELCILDGADQMKKMFSATLFSRLCDHCCSTKCKHGIVKFMKFMQHVCTLKRASK